MRKLDTYRELLIGNDLLVLPLMFLVMSVYVTMCSIVSFHSSLDYVHVAFLIRLLVGIKLAQFNP